jgi:hypothetical protein
MTGEQERSVAFNDGLHDLDGTVCFCAAECADRFRSAPGRHLEEARSRV